MSWFQKHRLTCRTSHSNKARVRLFESGQLCFRKGWIGFRCIITTMGGVGTHCFHSQVKYFVLQMPSGSSHSLHQGEKMFLILQRANQNIPYYVCDASNPWRGLEFSFSPKTGGWHGQYIQHTRPRLGSYRRLFSSPSLFHFLALIPSSVFHTSVLLRTNQRLYFTNVTLSRLWGGCGDNERLQRCETDRLKWIIRTESFCDANDTLQEIGSLSSI